MIPRRLAARLRQAVDETPVVVLLGPRGAGKSTLARTLAAAAGPLRAHSLDDPLDLAEAARDPRTAVAGAGLLVIDEAERLPSLLAAVAAGLAHDAAPGRALLTASVLGPALRAFVAEHHARTAVVPLWPLSAGELAGTRESFLDVLFAPAPPAAPEPEESPGPLAARLLRGGFPTPDGLDDEARRALLGERLGAALERDVRALAHLESLAALPGLLAAASGACGAPANLAELARAAGLAQTTLKRHLALLEAAFLLYRVPACGGQLAGRAARAPRLVPTDVGLAGHLLRADAGRLAGEPALLATLLSAYVTGELVKQASWRSSPPRVSHLASYSGEVVDVVLEDAGGGIAAVSVCARRTVDARAARAVAALARRAGGRFRRGVVLYLGGEAGELAEGVFALPMAALWATDGAPAEALPMPAEGGRPGEGAPSGPAPRSSGCAWDPGAGW